MRSAAAILSLLALAGALVVSQPALAPSDEPAVRVAPALAPPREVRLFRHWQVGVASPAELNPFPTDNQSPPGCLAITGRPLPASCEPCPPLWLGGPTIRCLSASRYFELIYGTEPSQGGPIRGLSQAGWLPACASVPMIPMQSPDSRLVARLCGAGLTR